MKKILSIVIVTLFITLSANGQNLLFIGDQSYPSTETYTLQSNSISPRASDLDVMFAKDGKTALFAVSRFSTNDFEIRGQLIIYLNDGSVIKLKQEGTDFVDNTSKAVYRLTESELSLIKNSNINTVRYTVDHQSAPGDNEESYTASNKGDSKIDFPSVVSAFFDI